MTALNNKSQQKKLTLRARRLVAVALELQRAGAKTVLDLGCGEGRLIEKLVDNSAIQRITGVDSSPPALQSAAKRLRLVEDPDNAGRIRSLHESIFQRDDRMLLHDAVVLVEVIEHLRLDSLSDLEEMVCDFLRPRTIIVTTPNREYNSRYRRMNTGSLRHPDHQFEWTRDEFQSWAGRLSETYKYRVRFEQVGPIHSRLGAPTQLCVFTRTEC